MTTKPPQLLRIQDVMERVGLRKSAIYNRVRAGTFPQPRNLGGRAVRWLAEDIDNWIESCPPPATKRPPP